jgi:hypothetical protein
MKQKKSKRKATNIPEVKASRIVEPKSFVYKMKKPPGKKVVEFVSLAKSGMLDAVEPIYFAKTPEAVSLYLILNTEQVVDSARLALALLDLLSAVQQINRELGGKGLTKSIHEQRPGRVVFAFHTESTGPTAMERLERIAKKLNQAKDFEIPPEVTNLRAVVM